MARSGELKSFKGPGDSSTCPQTINPTFTVVSTSVCLYGVTELGLGSHPSGSPTLEATPTTLQLLRFDQLVHLTTEGGGFLHIRNPNIPTHTVLLLSPTNSEPIPVVILPRYSSLGQTQVIPGCLNMITDRLRPYQPINMKWSLHPEIETLIIQLWSLPTVDKFTSVLSSPHNCHLSSCLRFWYPKHWCWMLSCNFGRGG